MNSIPSSVEKGHYNASIRFTRVIILRSFAKERESESKARKTSSSLITQHLISRCEHREPPNRSSVDQVLGKRPFQAQASKRPRPLRCHLPSRKETHFPSREKEHREREREREKEREEERGKSSPRRDSPSIKIPSFPPPPSLRDNPIGRVECARRKEVKGSEGKGSERRQYPVSLVH